MYYWPVHDLELEFFAPEEFDHPDRMDPRFLNLIDEWRRRCGFPIKVLDDARTIEEHRNLYRAEIERGLEPPDSSHKRGVGIDARPAGKHNTPMNRLRMVIVAHEMYEESVWPYLGLIVETRHIHADSDHDLFGQGKRPYFGIGISR